MRFNSRELAFLAQNSADSAFDKQGVLQIKEKQEGLFRKGEVYTERLVKLRGNLLFYFKSKDPKSEAIGVIVLERCTVELDPEEELDFSFVLRFEGDERTQYLAAKSERDRDKWIAALHIASYECMQMQLESLREQLKIKTGKDPLVNAESHTPLPITQGSSVEHGEPFLELCLRCSGLPKDGGGKPPNSFASVCISTPPQHHWLPHAHSEVVERSCEPVYLTTASFSDPNTVTLNTKIRITVYDVRERMTNTMTQIGSASFTVTDLLTAPDCQLSCNLSSVDYTQAGNVTVLAWQDQSLLGVQEMHPSQSTQDSTDNHVQTGDAGGSCGSHSKRLDTIKPLFTNILSKSYCFPTNGGSTLSVHEYMAESNLTYALPIQLLKIWVEEEKSRIEHLQDLGELTGVWDSTRKELMDFYMSTVTMYMQHARYLTSYKGPPFKPSVKKGHKEVEFAPVNLHLQRLWVSNENEKNTSFYDIITVGAFTAYAQKFKHGGLKRLMKQVKDPPGADNSKNRLEKVNEVLNQISILRDQVHGTCETLCRSAVQGDVGELQSAMVTLQDKARQLILVCESPLVEEGVQRFIEAKKDQKQQIGLTRPYSDPEGYLTVGEEVPPQPSPEKTWKWSGTDFIKSPTEEPWELTRLNTEAAIVCVLSKVEELVQQTDGEKSQWLEELSPLVIKLKSCAEVTAAKAKASLTLITLEDSSQNVALLHTIKYRRDVVFAQALTSAVTGFLTKIRSHITDQSFLKQLAQIGIFMEIESFLSCHSDEMGMLEDMAVGVADLNNISFKLIQSTEDIDEAVPQIVGNRTGYVVEVALPESMFKSLPRELQRGQMIKVCAVMFNIGINEQATFAERFGDTSTQEQVNQENFQRLNAYCEKYCEIIGQPEITEKGGLPMDLLLRNLHVNVVSKKGKNVDVLFMAAEICRRMKGVRYTNCKSGKDRTSMGATLEQVQLLQKRHDLGADVFFHVLDCMRSEGVRRENTLKNCGQRKYAFNSLQMLSIPKLFRPPHGTFGNVQA